MREDGKIDYVELPGGEMPATTRFYGEAFGWTFTDYGPDYQAFDQGLEGGFQTDPGERQDRALVVLYAHDLEAMVEKIKAAGGTIVRPIFSFPGGRRFHFSDPAGNELAVWSQS